MWQDTDRFVADWSASVDARAEQAWQLSRQVSELTVTAEGVDGAVKVTVAGSGAVTDLRLTGRALDLPAEQLAEIILDVMHHAQSGLAERVAELAAGTVGPESATGHAIVDSYLRRFPAPERDHG